MNWSVLIGLLLEFFGPILRKWLEELFEKAKPQLMDFTDESQMNSVSSAIIELFLKAREQTRWYEFRKRTVLKVCEKVARGRTLSFWSALRGGPKPQLAPDEAAQITAVL